MAEKNQNQTNYTQAPESGSSNFTRPPKSGSSDYTPTPKYEPKMSITEVLFITPFYLISDTIDLALLSFGLDDFGLMDLTRASISQIYFMFKKMGPEIWATNLTVNGIKLIPYIGSVIPSTLVWSFTVVVDRFGMAKFKKILEKTGKIGKMAKNIGGKIGKATGKV